MGKYIATVSVIGAVLLVVAALGVLYMRNQSAAESLSCQRRCEPRRWLIITDHCYCREMPDEWHGIDKDKKVEQ